MCVFADQQPDKVGETVDRELWQGALSTIARPSSSPMMRTTPISWLLVGMVALLGLASFAAANPGHGHHHHHHDPCVVQHDRWTWGAAEGEELDAEAMQVRLGA